MFDIEKSIKNLKLEKNILKKENENLRNYLNLTNNKNKK